MSLAATPDEKKRLSELIAIMLESSFYLEMDVHERLALIKVMQSSLS